jgi:hypothetical protein
MGRCIYKRSKVLKEEEYNYSSCAEIYGVGKNALEIAEL